MANVETRHQQLCAQLEAGEIELSESDVDFEQTRKSYVELVKTIRELVDFAVMD